MPTRNAVIHAVAVTLFLLSGLMGVFAAMGLCVQLWGAQVLHTALANPPDKSHPAYWVFPLVMLPAIVVGFVGGLFTFVVPLYAFFDLRPFNTGPRDQRLCALYIRLLQRIYARSWPSVESEPAVDHEHRLPPQRQDGTSFL